MPWSIVAAVACSMVASQARQEEARQEIAPPPEPEPTECASCGAPLSLNAVQCDYCKRLKEPRMFNWFKRTPKETPLQMQQRLAGERLRQWMLAQRSAPRTYSYSSSQSPAPAPQQSGPDLTSAYMGYLVGSSSSHSPAPAPEPQSFSSGGGGDYGGGGASGSWESSSSCSSSSYSSSDSSSSYSSSSDSGSSSSSCGGSD